MLGRLPAIPERKVGPKTVESSWFECRSKTHPAEQCRAVDSWRTLCGQIPVTSTWTILADYNRLPRWLENMNREEFKVSIAAEQAPPAGLSIPLAALWWDAKGDWARAHSLVDELESIDGMAVHAYLHRKEGSASNADYWYQRSGRSFYRPTLDAERMALIEGLLAGLLPKHRKA